MKKGHMQPRNIGITLALLMFLLFGSMAHQPTASAAKKKKAPNPAFLSQKSLRGAMQGRSGTVTIYYGGKKPQKVSALEGEHALDKYGYSLSSGDLNDDGNPDLVVGAPFHSPDPSLYQAGAVYVYFGPDYDPEDAIKIPASSDNKGIGFSLAAGDITNDGIDDLLMGASSKVIGYYGGTDIFPACPDPDFSYTNYNYSDTGFGRTITILWDVDNDSFNDIAVGAPQAVVAGTIDSGRLFILKGGPEISRTDN